MCGFAASCVCAHARPNGHIHGHVIGLTNTHVTSPKDNTNGHSNGHTNGYSNGYANGHTNGYTNGHTNGHVNGHTNGYTNGNDLSNGIRSAKESAKREFLAKQLQAAVDNIKHRGPDGSGVWISPDGKVGLGHCRLSINDLSPSGAQPLHSDDNKIHAVVNGEIYDFDRLRDICTTRYGYEFTGASDSELVVALYKVYGAPYFLEHLRGEFAFVLFDEREGHRRVIAGRDRFGIKPLLWTVVGDKVLFASEAKAFLPLGWEPEWNVRGITDSGWMMDDRTVFKGVRKLMPGHWMEITDERGVEIKKYWDAEYPHKMEHEPRTMEEMVLGVRERLVEAIKLRLRADVPIGIYLSGGIDSSTVAGIVTELIRKENVKLGSDHASRVACFSVSFPHESGYNESDIADRTAEWLGVSIQKREVNEERIAADFADAAYHCEHHHFDLNAVAKFALSTLPREHGVKVVLTGEGSDEHFCGYPYFPAEFLRHADLGMPDSILAKDNELRERMQLSASDEMNAVWHSQGATEYEGKSAAAIMRDAAGNTMPESLLAWHPANKLFQGWVQDLYQGKWDMRETVMKGHSAEVREKMREKWHPAHTAMYMWNKSTLINVILACLGDRTEMAHSIEARTPFLDHHLAEYVNNLPPSTKLNYVPPEENGVDDVNNFWWKAAGASLRSITEKHILREAARPYITDELYNRRKVPFLAPVRWPKDGPLHNMFRELLTREAVENLGFVDYSVVEHALATAFGDDGISSSFRVLTYCGGWVTLSQRFGIKKATPEESGWIV
ncbi:Amidase chyE [Paramyrothecium foliicola]|nr:Amidase chyE [Paramyrothecium foliicola]